MKAVIMAGGEGSRLRPLTCDRPKPMVPVMDRPIMEYSIELLKKHDINDIGVTLMYLPEEIKNYFGDGSEFNVCMRYFVEETPLGTAGSVKNGQEFLDQSFFVISGDALTDFDLSEIARFHRRKSAAVTIVLTRVKNPLEYGVVITDGHGMISRFLEKPSWGEVFSDTVNTGIYVIEPEVLDLIPENTKFDFSKDLFPMLLEKGYPMFGCVMPGYWCDIGNLSQYRQAHYDILSGFAQADISGTQIKNGVWVGEGTEIHPEAFLEPPVFIGRNVKIGKGAFVGGFSSVGSNSILDEESSLKKTITWSNVYIGKKSTVRGAAVCNRVKIKSQASVYEGAVIGDDTILDEYAAVKPEVKIWPHKMVEKGTVLSESLVWGARTCRNLFGTNGINGEINVEITPEFAAKLGAAYGSCIKKEGQVAVGADGAGCSQMIKNAVTTGLLSAGCHVLDLGQALTPITRYAVRNLGVNGAIQVTALDGGDKIRLTFFNDRGISISKAEERKIENAFLREDFLRITGSQVSIPTLFPDAAGAYFRDLINDVSGKIIRKAGFRMVLECDRMNSENFLSEMLKELGCHVYKTKSTDTSLGEKVTLHKCDMGASFSSDGESFILVDDRGRVLDEELLTTLVSLIILKANRPCTLVVPVTASGVIDEIAARFDGRVIRTKTGRQFLMSQALDDSVINTQTVYKQYLLQYDAVSTFVTILDYLAKEGTSLSEVVDSIPEFFVSRRDTVCPWHAKGTVMRRLIEEKHERTDLIDGVKIFHDNGWALVLPDSDEAVCRIFTEGANMEIAEDLTAMYVNKVNNLKKE